jgi:DNA-binding transcriptional LysR family regulator
MGSSSEWPTFRRVVVDMFQNAGLVMTVGQEASSLTGILGLVTAGVGITVFCGVPRFCVGSVIEARPIVTVPQTTVETHLAWRRSSASGAMRRFVETSELIGRESMTV